MERPSFNHSTKNIPVACPWDCRKQMIVRTEEFLRRMQMERFPRPKPSYTRPQGNFSGLKTIEQLSAYNRWDEAFWKIIQNIDNVKQTKRTYIGRKLSVLLYKYTKQVFHCANINLLLTDREGTLANIGPRSWQYGPSAARSVQKRPRANIPQYGLS